MKYARVPMRTKDGDIAHKVVRGYIEHDAFVIAQGDTYPPRYDPREVRKVELISKKEYFKAILNGEG